MRPRMCNIPFVLSILCGYLLSCCSSFQFDQNYFGVVLETDVHLVEGSSTSPPPGLYTFETIKTMLTVIGGRFSNVIVSDPINIHDGYFHNYTYWKGSRAAIFSGEAAALINRESGRKKLSLLYYIYGTKSDEQWETAISLVLEAAKRANDIFADTVTGLYVGGERNHDSVTRITLKLLQLYKSRASRLGLKMGARLNHFELRTPGDVFGNVKRIVEEADFIAFGLVPSDKCLSLGPVPSFESVSAGIIAFQNVLTKINPKTKVIAKTQWYSSGIEEWETLENLKVYWETSSKWAAEHKYNVYHWEAFNNPWRTRTHPEIAQRGWWKLTDNSKIRSVEGYVEKISEIRSRNTSISSSTTTTRIETVKVITEGTTTIKPNVTENTESSMIGNTFVIAAVGGLIGTALLLTLGVYYYFRTKKSTPSECDEIRGFLYGYIHDSPRVEEEAGSTVPKGAVNVPYDSSLEISKEKLKIDKQNILGVGHFGCVFKGRLELGCGECIEVAVKSIQQSRHSVDLRGILHEIKILTYLGSHPNIVALKGAYTAELTSGRVYVALELCTLGSLKRYLIQGQKSGMDTCVQKKFGTSSVYGKVTQETEMSAVRRITMVDLVRWASEIACGMEYLEMKHIVHADLATRNVLLTSDRTAKVADFGLSRRMYNYANYVKKQEEPLPWRWMAIESLRRLEFSSKTDVWSYGVTLWEIFSMGDVPYPGHSLDQNFIHQVTQGLRPECPLYASPTIYNVMQNCWILEPKDRPSFTKLLVFTKELLQQCIEDNNTAETAYLNLNSGSNHYVNVR